MSWDHELRTIPCPCGNGTIEKEVKSDDWGRYEEGRPYINCPHCFKKYSLITITRQSPHKWKGNSEFHFLVEKNVDLQVPHEQKYPRVNEHELCKKDFPHYLVVAYKMEWLIKSRKELSIKTSVASLEGFASSIARQKKKYHGGARIKDLREDVNIAINDYNCFIVNKEKLEEQDELDKKVREEWIKRVEENGLLLNI